jgi:transcriptional regulator with XRE-family HTH domain
MSERQIHHGRNVKRIREIQGIKQEALAIELGDDWNQKKVSLLESKEVIDDGLLSEIANVLKTTPDAIKNFNEDAASNFINTFNDNSVGAFNNFSCNFNPIDKWVEALEENRKLYERLLQTEREKIELLERMLNEKR